MTAVKPDLCRECGQPLPLWTRAQIIDRLQEWTGTHGEVPRSTDWTVPRYHTPSSHLVARRFGTWNQAIEAAGLITYRPCPRTTWTRDKVIRALWDWTAAHGKQPAAKDWDASGPGYPSKSTVAKLFGTWNRGLIAAGYAPTKTWRRRVAA